MSQRQGSNSKRNRVKEGVPSGGEFAAEEFEPGEADLSSDDEYAAYEDDLYPYEPDDGDLWGEDESSFTRPVFVDDLDDLGYDPAKPFAGVPDADDFHDESDITAEIEIPPPWRPKNPDPRHEWNITPEEEAERDAYEAERRAIIAKVQAREAAQRINDPMRIANDPVGMANDAEYARSLGYKGAFQAWTNENGDMEYDPAEWAGVNQFLDKHEAKIEAEIERGERAPAPVQHKGGAMARRSGSRGPYKGRNRVLGAASKQFGKLSDFLWNRWDDYLDS